DTFALPARGRNDAAAYAWINFTMRPDMAAKIASSVGSFSAANGADALVANHPKSVPMQSIHWYPAIPAGLEEMEGRVLDRVKAAN
ncbi:MAG: spermidine/putrescine ABC transporter substrate-binding protein, partial [Steroidobacterales bacterium]